MSGVTAEEMYTLHQVPASHSELPATRLLGEVIRALEGLSAELDQTRAERDRLRAIVDPERKAASIGGGA